MVYETGDTVSVTRRGLEITEIRDGRVWTRDSSGKVRSYYEYEVQIDVTKKAVKKPRNWPVQEGDVWHSEAYGKSLHVIGGSLYRNILGGLSEAMTPEKALRSFPDMRLVYRKF